MLAGKSALKNVGKECAEVNNQEAHLKPLFDENKAKF